MRQLRKMFTFSLHILFGFLVFRFFFQPSGLAVGFRLVILQGLLLVLVYSHFTHILRSYGNIFTRIMAMEAMVLGVPLAAASLYAGGEPAVPFLSVVSLLAWSFFAYRYWCNTDRYERQGCGPVPVDTCIKIPSELVRPGDAIGTGGAMAKLLRQGVAHTECVIPWEGKLMLFSSWFEEGACLNEVKRILKPDPKYPNYLLQRRPPLTPEQITLMEYVARSMRAQNKLFIERVKAQRERMPQWQRRLYDKHFPVTGYDWVGRYSGRRAPDRWTCNVAYLEVMRRSCVDVVRLGHGAAGLRTGWFDFPNTEDLRGDPALHLVRNAEVPGLLAGQTFNDPDQSIPGFAKRLDSLLTRSSEASDVYGKALTSTISAEASTVLASQFAPGTTLRFNKGAVSVGIVVGHGNERFVFSAHPRYGITLNSVAQVLAQSAQNGLQLTATAPGTPWSDEQCQMSLMVAKGMQRQNKVWIVRQQHERVSASGKLKLPRLVSRLMDKMFLPVTGYDWLGVVLTRPKMSIFTSKTAVKELVWRMGLTPA